MYKVTFGLLLLLGGRPGSLVSLGLLGLGLCCRLSLSSLSGLGSTLAVCLRSVGRVRRGSGSGRRSFRFGFAFPLGLLLSGQSNSFQKFGETGNNSSSAIFGNVFRSCH